MAGVGSPIAQRLGPAIVELNRSLGPLALTRGIESRQRVSMTMKWYALGLGLLLVALYLLWGATAQPRLDTRSVPYCSDLVKEMGSPLPEYALCSPSE
jgi:hypothetical protein